MSAVRQAGAPAAPARSAPGRRWPAPLGLAVTAAVGAGCAGAALAAVGLALEPSLGAPAAAAVLVGVPVALLGAVLALRDHRWAVALLAASLPAGLITLPGGVQVIQVAAAATVALVVLPRAWRGQRLLVTPLPVVALLALVVWSLVVSTPVARDLPPTLRWDVVLTVAVLLVAAVATAASQGLGALRSATAALCAGSVVTCALALPESAQRTALGGAVVDGRAQGVFSQPNELGLFAGTTVVLATALLVGARSALGRCAAGAGAAVALVALALSLSRGAWVGTVVALAVAALLVPAVRAAVAVTVVVVALVVLGASLGGTAVPGLAVVGERAALVADRGANPYDERPAIWDEAWRQVRAHPVTGVGPAGFRDAAERSPSAVVAAARPEHAHDVVLTVAAEQGLPAAGALVVALGATGVALVRVRLRPAGRPARSGCPVRSVRDRSLVAVVGCSLLVVGVHGLVDAPLRNPTTLLQTAAVLGLVVATTRLHRAAPAGDAS